MNICCKVRIGINIRLLNYFIFTPAKGPILQPVANSGSTFGQHNLVFFKLKRFSSN